MRIIWSLLQNNDYNFKKYLFLEITAKPPPVKEEPEKIRKWREEQKARLEEKGITYISCNFTILNINIYEECVYKLLDYIK